MQGLYLLDQYGKEITPSNPLPVSYSGSNSITGDVLTVVTTGTAVQLPNIACSEVTLIGLKANSATVYVGSSDVTTSVYGVALDQKDSVTLKVNNADLIYINGTAGDGVSYVAV